MHTYLSVIITVAIVITENVFSGQNISILVVYPREVEFRTLRVPQHTCTKMILYWILNEYYLLCVISKNHHKIINQISLIYASRHD